MLTLQAWYLIGVIVCAGAFAFGIGETDGYDALRDRRAYLPILIGALVVGLIWPLIIIAFLATSFLEHRRNKLRERRRG